MTIAVAWVRTVKSCEELIFVTDSRLSGDGRTFDACTKAITLPRSDCAIAFAGFSGHGYPMMQQLSNAIDAHSPLKRGTVGVSQLKTHAVKIFESMGSLIFSSDRVSSPTDTDPEAEFLFGGYNWISKKFDIWNISYSKSQKKFISHLPRCVKIIDHNKKFVFSSNFTRDKENRIKGDIAIAGDQAPKFEEKLLQKLSAKGKIDSFDMEPFEVIRDMLREKRRSETIGGAPQIIKVYQYMNSAPLGVYWPDKASGKVHLQGRPCLGYERIDRWVLDPDLLISNSVIIEDSRQNKLLSENDPSEPDIEMS